ncbi:MAG: hypothetical protein NVSMB27_00620 [Ktedonobacteraceae bacterium]
MQSVTSLSLRLSVLSVVGGWWRLILHMKREELSKEMTIPIDAARHFYYPCSLRFSDVGRAMNCQEWSVEVCEETTREVITQ